MGRTSLKCQTQGWHQSKRALLCCIPSASSPDFSLALAVCFQATPLFPELCREALSLVLSCPCPYQRGCPSCVQHLNCSNYNAVINKQGAQLVLQVSARGSSGGLHHLLGHWQPNDGQSLQFAYLHSIDTAESQRQRVGRRGGSLYDIDHSTTAVQQGRASQPVCWECEEGSLS